MRHPRLQHILASKLGAKCFPILHPSLLTPHPLPHLLPARADGVVVAQPEWQFVNEKVGGLVAQIVTHRSYYAIICETHLKEIVCALLA